MIHSAPGSIRDDNVFLKKFQCFSFTASLTASSALLIGSSIIIMLPRIPVSVPSKLVAR